MLGCLHDGTRLMGSRPLTKLDNGREEPLWYFLIQGRLLALGGGQQHMKLCVSLQKGQVAATWLNFPSLHLNQAFKCGS